MLTNPLSPPYNRPCSDSIATHCKSEKKNVSERAELARNLISKLVLNHLRNFVAMHIIDIVATSIRFVAYAYTSQMGKEAYRECIIAAAYYFVVT